MPRFAITADIEIIGGSPVGVEKLLDSGSQQNFPNLNVKTDADGFGLRIPDGMALILEGTTPELTDVLDMYRCKDPGTRKNAGNVTPEGGYGYLCVASARRGLPLLKHTLVVLYGVEAMVSLVPTDREWNIHRFKAPMSISDLIEELDRIKNG